MEYRGSAQIDKPRNGEMGGCPSACVRGKDKGVGVKPRKRAIDFYRIFIVYMKNHFMSRVYTIWTGIKLGLLTAFLYNFDTCKYVQLLLRPI